MVKFIGMSGIQLDPSGLEFGVLVEGVQRLVAALAGLLEAAEGRVDGGVVVAVYLDGAGAVAVAKVVGPDRCAESIVGIVGDCQGLVETIDADRSLPASGPKISSRAMHMSLVTS